MEGNGRSSTLATVTKGKSVAITQPQSKHIKITSRAASRVIQISSFDPLMAEGLV
jgi:hypothetical protein